MGFHRTEITMMVTEALAILFFGLFCELDEPAAGTNIDENAGSALMNQHYAMF